VAAHGDRRRVAAAGPQREHVADAVDGDRAARVAQPARDEVAPLAVEIGERQSPHTALLGGADRGEAHQAVPQAVCVHAQTG